MTKLTRPVRRVTELATVYDPSLLASVGAHTSPEDRREEGKERSQMTTTETTTTPPQWAMDAEVEWCNGCRGSLSECIARHAPTSANLYSDTIGNLRNQLRRTENNRDESVNALTIKYKNSLVLIDGYVTEKNETADRVATTIATQSAEIARYRAALEALLNVSQPLDLKLMAENALTPPPVGS
jgi:uncharacterized coiled-coil protein SlyX